MIHGDRNNGFNAFGHPNDQSSFHLYDNRIPMNPRPRFIHPIALQGGEWVMDNEYRRNDSRSEWNEYSHGGHDWNGSYHHGRGDWNDHNHGHGYGNNWSQRSW